GERHLVTRRGAGHGAERAREPGEQIAEPQALELERLAHRDLAQDVEVRALGPHGEEHERLRLLALADELGGLGPGVGRRAVRDEKDPGPVVGDPVLLVYVLALPERLEAGLDGLA